GRDDVRDDRSDRSDDARADDDARRADVATDHTDGAQAGRHALHDEQRTTGPATDPTGQRSPRTEEHTRRPTRARHPTTTTPASTAASANGSWTPCSATPPSSGTTARPVPGATTPPTPDRSTRTAPAVE